MQKHAENVKETASKAENGEELGGLGRGGSKHGLTRQPEPLATHWYSAYRLTEGPAPGKLHDRVQAVEGLDGRIVPPQYKTLTAS